MKTEKLIKKTEKIFADYIIENNGKVVNTNRIDVPESIHFMESSSVAETFKLLDWSFTENDTTYLSHDVHPYPAKFVPQLPAQVIKLLSSVGEVIWDPFGGSGTTALEALLNDRICISTDINPIGEIIGKAKTTSLKFCEEEELEHFISRLEVFKSNSVYLQDYIECHKDELAKEIPEIPNMEKWFSNIVICELAFIKHLIKTELSSSATKNIAYASFSKIITKVSNQENETTYRAIPRESYIGETIYIYIHDIQENFAKVKALGRLLGYKSGKFITANVMEDIVGKNKAIQENEIDLVVTSPPYPNAFDYHLYHRFRIFWLDSDPRAMGKVEIGSHLNYQRKKCSFEAFEVEMKPVLENCYKALKPGRYAVFVLGDAIFDGVKYDTAKRIGDLSKIVGFEVITIVKRPLPENKRSVTNAGRRATDEQILVVRKTEKKIECEIETVPYKLYPYENDIYELEKKALLGTSDEKFDIEPINVNNLKKLTFVQNYTLNGSVFRTWQSMIEQGEKTELKRKDPKYVTHGIHPYKGKFYPQLVRPLLNIFNIPENGIIFDPFCGSGTVALESVLNGYNAYACDVNPIAVEIARAKSNILTVAPYDFEKQIVMFKKSIENYAEADYTKVFSNETIEEIDSWFPKSVVNKMGFLLEKIGCVPDEKIKCFLKVVLSSIIREVSQQDTGDLRIRRRKEPIEDAYVIEMFLENLQEQYVKIMDFHRHKNYAPANIGKANIWCGSSKDKQNLSKNISKESIDIVITSPPYATALPYIDTNRLNILVINGLNASERVHVEEEMTGTREIKKTKRTYYENLIEQNNFGMINSSTAVEIINKVHYQNKNAEVGFRKKNMAALLYMYFHDMTEVFCNLNDVVKKDGYICIIIGDTKTTTGEETISIRTTEVLRETGLNMGWELEQDIPISVTVEKFVHMHNSITENNILVFKKCKK